MKTLANIRAGLDSDLGSAYALLTALAVVLYLSAGYYIWGYVIVIGFSALIFLIKIAQRWTRSNQEETSPHHLNAAFWGPILLLPLFAAMVAVRKILLRPIDGPVLWIINGVAWLLVPLALYLSWSYFTKRGSARSLKDRNPKGAEAHVHRAQTAVAWILFLGAALVLLLTSFATRLPNNDMDYLARKAAHVLLQGKNPYLADIENIFIKPPPERSSQSSQEAGALTGGDRYYEKMWYPYSPAALVAATLGFWIAGDVRPAHALALILSAVFILLFLRHSHFSTPEALGFSAIWLMFPLHAFIISEAPNDPVLILAAAVVFWALATGRKWWLGFALATAIAVKVYAVFLVGLVLVFLVARDGPRKALPTALIMALFVALWFGPFMLSEPGLVFFRLTHGPYGVRIATWALTIPTFILNEYGVTVPPLYSAILDFCVFALFAIALLWRKKGAELAFFWEANCVLYLFVIVCGWSSYGHQYQYLSFLLYLLILSWTFQARDSNGGEARGMAPATS